MSKEKWALISVYSKEGIVKFAQSLIDLGWKILASGGTAKVLGENGIAVKDVADLVGGGAILAHHDCTLSREIHAGLLAKDNEEDRAELAKLGVPFIDMVVCDFYPLSAEIASADCTTESVIEKTDIGGPTMVRSAAKGGRIVVVDPTDRLMVLSELEENSEVTIETRQYLHAKAEFIVSGYCFDSARFHSGGDYDGLIGRLVQTLAYGENRDQSPANLFMGDKADPLAWGNFKVLTGEPSYISIADGDRALGVMCALCEAFRLNFTKVPFVAVACKHGNPCGIGISFELPAEALSRALFGDPVAVMGAELMTNFPITQALGIRIYEVMECDRKLVGRQYWGIDVLFAPAVDESTVELLGKKARRRILVNPALVDACDSQKRNMIEPVRGGFLRQRSYHYILDFGGFERQIGQFCPEQKINAIIAWAAAWRSVSNTVALANNGRLIGLGCGQQDRIACVQLCLEKAKRSGHETFCAIFASDGFFPFARRKPEQDLLEGPELLINSGCSGGLVPYEGNKIEEVYDFFEESGVSVGFIPSIHRGFFGHG